MDYLVKLRRFCWVPKLGLIEPETQLPSGYSRIDVMTLHVVAMKLSQQLKGTLGANTLGNHIQAEVMTLLNHGTNNRNFVGLVFQVVHKGLIDLDLIHGKILEVSQRGIPGTEIVDSHPHA